MGYQLEKLLEEIDFWQMLVDGFNGNKNEPSFERLTAALALAEYRFSKACGAQAMMH